MQLYKTFLLCNYGERRTETDGQPHFSILNYTKLLFWIIAKSICSYSLFIYIHIPLFIYTLYYATIYYYMGYTTAILYIIFYDIMRYYTLCYIVIDTTLCDIMDYILFMRFYAMKYYVILYAILSNVVFNTTLCGFVYSYLAKVNIIYSQKIFKTF